MTMTKHAPATPLPLSPVQQFYATQSAGDAILLAIADHHAFTKDHPMYEFIAALQKAKERCDAYPKLVEALRGMVREHGAVDDATVVSAALLRSLGEE